MISALHLIWILPLSTLLGFFWAAWLAGGQEKTRGTRIHDGE